MPLKDDAMGAMARVVTEKGGDSNFAWASVCDGRLPSALVKDVFGVPSEVAHPTLLD